MTINSILRFPTEHDHTCKRTMVIVPYRTSFYTDTPAATLLVLTN